MEETTYSATETASRLGISAPTLNRRVAAGEINPLPKAPGQKKQYRLRFSESEIERVIKESGEESPQSPFSKEQNEQFWKVSQELSDKLGFDTSVEHVWVGRSVVIYLHLVHLKLSILNEKSPAKSDARLLKQVEKQKREQLKTLRGYWQKQDITEAIIEEIEKTVSVPEIMKEIIRYDMAQT